MDPLVSVIVPIYNVEPWIRKCLDSLRGQTLKQIEVICVDDDSIDESGRIADEYGREDPRFRVIHHNENRGLSAARNTGIDEAKAEFLMFVDSDDWVEPEFCRLPYRAAIENQADIVLFRHYEVNKKQCKKIKNKAFTRMLTNEEAIDVGGLAVWRKFFRRDLFDNIRLPEGYVYEDIAITHKLIYCAARIVSIQDYLYFHRMRNRSISQATSNDSDLLKMSLQRAEELIQLGYPKRKANALLIDSALRCCGCTQNKDDILFIQAKQILQDVNRFPVELPKKIKLKLFLWRMNSDLFRTVYRASRKRTMGNCDG